MVSLILGSDLAFVSGGRTICELAAAGTPGIVFAQNELEYCRLRNLRNGEVCSIMVISWIMIIIFRQI